VNDATPTHTKCRPAVRLSCDISEIEDTLTAFGHLEEAARSAVDAIYRRSLESIHIPSQGYVYSASVQHGDFSVNFTITSNLFSATRIKYNPDEDPTDIFDGEIIEILGDGDFNILPSSPLTHTVCFLPSNEDGETYKIFSIEPIGDSAFLTCAPPDIIDFENSSVLECLVIFPASDCELVEGDPIRFEISLQSAGSHQIEIAYTVDFATLENGEDGDTVSGSVTFEPGRTSAAVIIECDRSLPDAKIHLAIDHIRPTPMGMLNDCHESTTVMEGQMIHKNWMELIKPTQLDIKPSNEPTRQATIIAEHLERGFGLTLGSALREVLMTSLVVSENDTNFVIYHNDWVLNDTNYGCRAFESQHVMFNVNDTIDHLTKAASYFLTMHDSGASSDLSIDGSNLILGFPVTADEDTPNNYAATKNLKGSISGKYFCDENNNDVQRAGELGLAGVVVTARDATGNVAGTMTTDADSNYIIRGQDEGFYSVEFTDPNGVLDEGHPDKVCDRISDAILDAFLATDGDILATGEDGMSGEIGFGQIIDDGGIMDLWVREARLFKDGSSTGTDFSWLYEEREELSGGYTITDDARIDLANGGNDAAFDAAGMVLTIGGGDLIFDGEGNTWTDDDDSGLTGGSLSGGTLIISDSGTLSGDAYIDLTIDGGGEGFVLADDDDGSIMDFWIREARLFKYVSDTATNFSSLHAGRGKMSGAIGFVQIIGNGSASCCGAGIDLTNGGDSATDNFSYTVSDGSGGTDTATVTITVGGVQAISDGDAIIDDVSFDLTIGNGSAIFDGTGRVLVNGDDGMLSGATGFAQIIDDGSASFGGAGIDLANGGDDAIFDGAGFVWADDDGVSHGIPERANFVEMCEGSISPVDQVRSREWTTSSKRSGTYRRELFPQQDYIMHKTYIDDSLYTSYIASRSNSLGQGGEAPQQTLH